MPRLADDTKTEVVRVRLPQKTVREVEDMVSEAGMYKSYFWQVAALLGARALLRMMVPEHFITAQMMSGAVQGMGVALSDEEKAALSSVQGGGEDDLAS